MGARVVLVVGTRPEAIKMAPVHRALSELAAVSPVLVSTGQHRELLASALDPLGLTPDHDLAVMTAGQSPNDVLRRVLEGLEPLLRALAPAAVLVQGDTTTVLGAALCAYHLGVPVGHVEAGLRTYDHAHPFPEEANRQLTDRLCRWCFAPTEGAAQHLRAERIAEERIVVTGNTAVDAILWAAARSDEVLAEGTLLMTLHRRESFGPALREMLRGVRDFLEATPGATALWPVHPNPQVVEAADELFADVPSVKRVPPLPYLRFAGALKTCRLVLTDSGGIQEEGPSLGKTVLVARETTERPEALGAAGNRLVGRSRAGVRDALLQAWSEPLFEGPLPAPNPYGDGQAGRRIAEHLAAALQAAATR